MPDHKPHGTYLREVSAIAEERREAIIRLFRDLFPDLIIREDADYIHLGSVQMDRLSSLLFEHGVFLKPLLAICNMGGRAPSQDLGMKKLDTIVPILSISQAKELAEYLSPMLPPKISLEAIARVDSYQFVDTQIRKAKGAWEACVSEHLRAAGLPGVKRRFTPSNDHPEKFEVDFALPAKGQILLGIDIKHIGHPRDIQKRGDEIVNKAAKLWQRNPEALFIAIVKFPYPDEHLALKRRLVTTRRMLDGIFITGDDPEDLRRTAVAVKRIVEHRFPELVAS